MRLSAYFIAALALTTAAACGDNGRECGPGTHDVQGRCLPDNGGADGGLACGDGTYEWMGQCVPYDPNDTTAPTTTADPPGGAYYELPSYVRLESDEPAIIYYTTDGSTPDTSSASEVSPVVITTITDGMEIKFFAVDPTGNTETVQTATYTVDQTAPGPVTNFAAADDGTDVTLTWDNPTDADLAGVLIVRSVTNAVEFMPTQGQTYNVGDTVAPGEEIIFAAAGTTTVDSAAMTGYNGYRAFAFDGAHNYSTGADASIDRGAGAQDATLEVDNIASSPTVQVLKQPDNWVLSATASYMAGTNELLVRLTLDNRLGHAAFNTKILVTSTNQGTFSNSSGTFDGFPYRLYVRNSIPNMETHTFSFNFTGVDATVDPILIDLRVLTHSMILMGSHYSDREVLLLDEGRMALPGGNPPCDAYVGNTGSNSTPNLNGVCSWPTAVLSPDARYIFAGNRSRPGVRVVDTATWQTVSSFDLAPGATYGSIASLTWDQSKTHLYAVVNTTGHQNGFGFTVSDGDVILVEMTQNANMLTETGRTTLTSALAADGVRGRRMSISPDGTRAAVPLFGKGEVAFVDLSNLQVIDTDAATAGVQNLDVSTISTTPRETVFAPDSSKLYVGFSRKGGDTNAIQVVDLSDFSQTTLATTVAGAGAVNDLQFDANGRLWVAWHATDASDAGAISVYDLSGPTETVIDTTTTMADNGRYANAIAFSQHMARAYVAFQGDPNAPTWKLATIDTSTLTRVDADGDSSNGVTNVSARGKPGAHWSLVTP